MKVLVLGRNGYVSLCFQNYMKQFTDCVVEAISVRSSEWEDMDFGGYDAVFNATGLAHNNARKGTDEEFVRLNVELPKRLATKAKKDGVPVFIHMSSMIVYGNTNTFSSFNPINEGTVPMPDNIYGKSKLMGEDEINKLADDGFKVAIIRSPLVYGENATDNFEKLTKLSLKAPLFPYIHNYRSMIYADNLCELVRLIAESKQGGSYYPQQEKYICTSDLVKDIANTANHRIWMTTIFNFFLLMLGKRFGVVSKVFGNEGYDMAISNHFNGKYRRVSYQQSIEKILEKGK